MTTVEIWQSNRAWFWHAKGGNGEIIAQSEGYTRKAGARRGARRAFPDAKVVYR